MYSIVEVDVVIIVVVVVYWQLWSVGYFSVLIDLYITIFHHASSCIGTRYRPVIVSVHHLTNTPNTLIYLSTSTPDVGGLTVSPALDSCDTKAHLARMQMLREPRRQVMRRTQWCPPLGIVHVLLFGSRRTCWNLVFERRVHRLTSVSDSIYFAPITCKDDLVLTLWHTYSSVWGSSVGEWNIYVLDQAMGVSTNKTSWHVQVSVVSLCCHG